MKTERLLSTAEKFGERDNGGKIPPVSDSPGVVPLPGFGLGAILLFFSRWWSERGGGKEVLYLALPMIVSAGSLALMQFADRVFLTWFDPAAVGASFSGGQLFWLLASFPFSVTSYTVAFVSQYNGARQFDKIGGIVWQGIFLSLALIPVFFALNPLGSVIFHFFGHTEELARQESIYLYWSLWGLGPLIANESMAAFFSGRKRMRTVMMVNIVAVLVNVLLDYAMIFGVCGFPRWGLAGAAIATSISQWIRTGIFFTLMVMTDWRSRGRYGVRRGCRFIPSEQIRLLTFGGMGGVQFFFEVGSFAIVVLLIGNLGEVAATASAIALNLNAMTFLPILGTGIAVMTLVGNYLGEDNPALARRCTLSAAGLGVVFTGFFMVIYLVLPGIFLAAYASGDPEAFAPYYDLTKVLLRFVAVYLFFDTVNVIFCSAIKGAGDTRFVMRVTLALVPFLAIFSWAGIRFLHYGVFWCWTILTLYICVIGAVYYFRFLGGRWMSMRLLRNEAVEDRGGSVSG